MPEQIYINQVKAGNELYEIIGTESVPVSLLVASPQSGKTGAMIHLCEKLYDDNYRFLIFGPSDTALKNQTQERIEMHPKISANLLGSKVWHAGDIYSSGTSYQELCRHIRDAKVLEHKVLIVFDEAHIGIGMSKKDMQKIPQFLAEVCECLPGDDEQRNENIQALLITATPFTYDAFQKRTQKFREVYLQPGPEYVGLGELQKDSRLRTHIRRDIPTDIRGKDRQDYKKRQNKDFVSKITKLIEKHTKDGYVVVRCTVSRELSLFSEACAMAGVKLKVFESRTNNILQFEKTLQQPQSEPTVLLVKQSYKQGKTLCLDNIAAWYENDTWTGRHDADMAQSVGRVLGYHKSKKYDFPIYCDVESIISLIEYYEECSMGDFTSKREKPHSSTHTKHKIFSRPVVKYQVAQSFEKAVQMYRERYPNHGATPNRMTVSKINSYDAIHEILTGTERSFPVSHRKADQERMNIYHIDKPSRHPNSSVSLMSVPHLHGKYVFNEETDEETIHVTTTDKSYLSHVDKK